jgi:predicted dehydrogenase
MPTRRSFIRTVAAAPVMPFLLPSRVWADPPSRKLAHAAIGCSNQAWADIQALDSSGKIEVTALCDVDASVAEAARAKWPRAKFYQDWRQLLHDEGARLDSVNLAVPDHMHASIALSALRAGKHVYGQKPLTHSISEGRALATAAAAARQNGVVTQMGNQIQSTNEYRTAVALLQRGEIGKIKEIHLWVAASYGGSLRPTGADPVPNSLAWDQWLGVAPVRPFKTDAYHRFNWRAWRDFGGGAVLDFVCHIADTPMKALGFGAPLSVEGVAFPAGWTEQALTAEAWPTAAEYRWEFAPTALCAGPMLPIHWYDGDRRPDSALINGGKLPPSGALFIGESGNLVLPHWAMPHRSDYKRLEFPALEPRDHYHHFVQCALSGGKEETGSPFTYGGPLAELGQLANIASRFPGQKLVWDAPKMGFPHHPAANAFVRRAYRDGWKIEGLG